MKVLVVGELNVDLILSGYSTFPTLGKEVLVEDLTLTLGSSSAICAVGIARLGNQVSFLGKVGCDPWGDFCIDALNAAGVDTAPVLRDAGVKTGLTASITSRTDRALVTYMGAISELKRADVTDQVLAGFHHLHVSSYYLQTRLRPGLRELFSAARSHGMTTSLDPGYDPAETWDSALIRVLEQVDIFLPNESEIRGITGREDIVEGLRALENGRTLTIAKLGRDGAMAIEAHGTIHVPAIPVEPVDTTGAGDSFNAGFLHARLRGFPMRDTLQFACACGALSTLGIGGTGAQATEGQVYQFLESRGIELGVSGREGKDRT